MVEAPLEVVEAHQEEEEVALVEVEVEEVTLVEGEEVVDSAEGVLVDVEASRVAELPEVVATKETRLMITIELTISS